MTDNRWDFKKNKPKVRKSYFRHIIYLDKKHRRADKEHIVHVVRGGESMYSISQKYGIRLKNLYKMNKMKPEDPSPKVGDILRLR